MVMVDGDGNPPVYEYFKPISGWQQDDDSHILIIYLPGFTEEDLRVSTEGQNIVRVRGTRLVPGNIWSRFAQDFQVPENCEMSSIRSKLEGGFLTITVPRKPLPPKTSTILDTEKKSVGTAVQQAAARNEISELKQTHSVPERTDDVLKTTGESSEKSKELLPAKRVKVDGLANEAKEKDKESKGKETSHSKVGKYKISELNEERQLLVNMGVAVLVIVALSAFVTYKFASGKDKN